MVLKKAPPLLARVLLVVSSILAVGALFLFFSEALAPVEAPSVPLPKVAKPFNPKADISNHPSFQQMHLPDVSVPEFATGKDNPFLPATASTSTDFVTTTESVKVPIVSDLRFVTDTVAVPAGSATSVSFDSSEAL